MPTPNLVEASETAQLEFEMLELSHRLSEFEWRTTTYCDFEDEILRFENGETEEEVFIKFLEEREQSILQILDDYEQSSILSHEVTAESVVGHRLLGEGIRGWLLGVQMVLNGESDAGLAEVETGNRLLVAVQRLNQRTQAQLLP